MEEIKEPQEMAVANPESTAVAAPIGDLWTNPEVYAMSAKLAKVLASSDLVPEGTYRGKPANCLVALDMANRMKTSPLMVMQSLYIVKGKPSWSGQYCISAINGCGRFSPLSFEPILNTKGELDGYRAVAINLATKAECSSSVTWAMVKGEGWLDKPGSKWKTMPEQMFKYRCAAFFARTYCPDVLMGLYTADEMRDVHGNEDESKATVVITTD